MLKHNPSCLASWHTHTKDDSVTVLCLFPHIEVTRPIRRSQDNIGNTECYFYTQLRSCYWFCVTCYWFCVFFSYITKNLVTQKWNSSFILNGFSCGNECRLAHIHRLTGMSSLFCFLLEKSTSKMCMWQSALHKTNRQVKCIGVI